MNRKGMRCLDHDAALLGPRDRTDQVNLADVGPLAEKAAMAAPITRMSSSLSPSATAGRAGGGDGASPGAFVSASVLTIAAVGTGDVAAASSAATRWPRRLNSRLRPSRASITLVRSTVSDFHDRLRLRWDQAVLLRRPMIARAHRHRRVLRAMICSPVTCLMTWGPVMNIWALRVMMMKSVKAGE